MLALAWAQPFRDVQPLEGRSLENVVAFSRLLGYIRYFHPSDAAYTTDWESFAIAHIESVEDAPTPLELAQRLERLFVPYAPTLRIFPSATTASLSPLTMPLGVQPLYVTTLVRTIMGESDTLLLLRGDRISIPVQNRQLPTAFEYMGSGLLRFPKPQVLPLPDPGKPYLAALGGGVSAAIPLAVYSTQSATLPRVAIPKRAVLSPNTAANNPAAIRNRANRLALVGITWNAYQHLFPYWNEVQGDWLAALPKALSQAAIADDEPTFTAVLQRLAAGLQDGHNFIDRSGRSAYGSHTVPFTMDLIEGQLVVTTFLGTNHHGLQLGDVITRLDGKPALEALAEISERISGSEAYRRYLGLAWLMGGSTGSFLTVEVLRSNAERLELRIPRPIAKRRSLPPHEREPRPPVLAQLAPGVLYLDLTRVEENRFEAILPILASASAMVLDMRGYANELALQLLAHLTDQPLNSPPFAIPIVTQPDHQNIQYLDISRVWVQPKAPRLTRNIAFITNANGTISYSESILSIAAGYKLGQLVGQPSAGANGNVVNLILPSRYITRWTGLRVTNFDGSRMFALGIQPNIAIERTVAGVAAGRDELLEAAFTVVTQRSAQEMQIKPLAQR